MGFFSRKMTLKNKTTGNKWKFGKEITNQFDGFSAAFRQRGIYKLADSETARDFMAEAMEQLEGHDLTPGSFFTCYAANAVDLYLRRNDCEREQ
jgi:hypothetical protein